MSTDTESICRSQVVVGCAVGQIALAVALRMLLQRRNSQRDAAAAFALDADLPDSLELLEDITDFEVGYRSSLNSDMKLTDIESALQICSVATSTVSKNP